MSYINFNGKIIYQDQAILRADNRALKYGDGLFETVRVINGHIPFAKFHYERLVDGLNVLSFKVHNRFSFSFFKREILQLTNETSSRVRFSVFRKPGGLYLPGNNQFDFLIESSPLKDDAYVWNKKGIHLGLSKKVSLSCDTLAPLKTLNALPYIMAANECQQQKVDDIILLNQHGRIAEANSSNVFIWTGRTLKTSSLLEGCIAGVIRRVLLEKASSINIKAIETKLSLNDLRKAKAVLLTNSIQGIRWVKQFEKCKFAPDPGPELLNLLNEQSQL